MIKAGQKVFADLPAGVEIRNEARVHLWYEEKFAVAYPPYDSTEAAIDSFAATTCCLRVRVELTAGGVCMRRTGFRTCSTSSFVRIRCRVGVRLKLLGCVRMNVPSCVPGPEHG